MQVLNVLVDLCYTYKDDLVVVLAGYTHAMSDLFEGNAGLASRFPHKFHFADYDASELEQIARRMLDAAFFRLRDADAAAALERLVQPITRERPCGNARSVENRIATAILCQSQRLRKDSTLSNAAGTDQTALFELKAEDLDSAAEIAGRASAVLERKEEAVK